MNKVILIGNLTKDPELKKTSTGKSVASCSIATNKSYKDKNGERQSIVQFHNLVIWGLPAETFCKFLKKGSKVGIVGEIQTRSYDDKQNVKRYVTEINVNEFEFLTPLEKKSDQQEYSQTEREIDHGQYQNSENPDEINVGDIPF